MSQVQKTLHEFSVIALGTLLLKTAIVSTIYSFIRSVIHDITHAT